MNTTNGRESSCFVSRRFPDVMIHFLLIILVAIYEKSSGLQIVSDPTIGAKVGEFSYVVMVWHSGAFHCSGIIIDERNIITRASCVIGIPRSDLSIIAGSIDVKVGRKQSLQVERIYIHNGFKVLIDVQNINEVRYSNDIAVLKLVNRMVWNSVTAPAILTTGNHYGRKNCVVPGWRHTLIGKPREHYYIRWMKVNIHTDEFCTGFGIHLLENEECVPWKRMNEQYLEAIHYYHGSPIICQNAVVGIVDGRERGTFHVTLKLFPYKDFIQKAIDAGKYDVISGEINFVVSVWYEYRFKCGGIIFGASHILTTADCVQYANHTRLQVIAGHTQILDYDDQIQWLSVSNIEIHANYEEIIYFDGPRCMYAKNNYALLTLTAPLEWGPTIGPAPLSNTHFVPANSTCRAYRWYNAYTVDDKVLLQLIQSQEVIMNAEVCQEAGIVLEADEICVNSQYAQHPRNLDSSGNPLICEGFVIGIIVPDYSTIPRLSHLTSILSIWPLMNSLNYGCYIPPIY